MEEWFAEGLHCWVKTRLAPLLNNEYDDVEQLDREIEFVAGMLANAAERLLSLVHPKRPTRWRDILSSLCAQCRVALLAWKEAGCPLEGPLYEEKEMLQWAVRRIVRFCATQAERKHPEEG